MTCACMYLQQKLYTTLCITYTKINNYTHMHAHMQYLPLVSIGYKDGGTLNYPSFDLSFLLLVDNNHVISVQFYRVFDIDEIHFQSIHKYLCRSVCVCVCVGGGGGQINYLHEYKQL